MKVHIFAIRLNSEKFISDQKSLNDFWKVLSLLNQTRILWKEKLIIGQF